MNVEQEYDVIFAHHYDLGAVYIPIIRMLNVPVFYLEARFVIDADLYAEKFPDITLARDSGDIYVSSYDDVLLKGVLSLSWHKETWHSSRFTLSIKEVVSVKPSSSGRALYASFCGFLNPF